MAVFRVGVPPNTGNGSASLGPLPRRTVENMDHKSEIREFLSSRRAKITPAQAGLPSYGGTRRVKGLRREEVSLLAGVSIDYYVRMERGTLAGVSEGVLEAVARALQLDDAEREHLLALAGKFALAKKPVAVARARRRTAAVAVRPNLQEVLDAMPGIPAWIRNARHDFLAGNHLARALYAPILASPHQPANTARFVYLDPASKSFFTDWDRAADDLAAMLRQEAGRNPCDKALTELVGELSTRSEDFRQRWAAHNVRFHRTGTKKLHHPLVGGLDLNYEAMEFPSDPGLTMLVYTAPAGSPSSDALQLLGSWTSAPAQSGPGAAAQDPSIHQRTNP